jgi:hypothetical protein
MDRFIKKRSKKGSLFLFAHNFPMPSTPLWFCFCWQATGLYKTPPQLTGPTL